MNTELKKAIDQASEAVEQLKKSEVGGSIHTEALRKSHVKEYTRTTASGASVQVKEHDDKRQAAQKASKLAEETQAKHNWDDPRDTKVVAANHADAAHAHVEALRHASTNEQINEHMHAASRHLQANHSMASYHRGNEENHAENSGNHANEITRHAFSESHDDKGNELPSHDSATLNKRSSLHMLAMEQHMRASTAYMALANKHYGKPGEKEAQKKADFHTGEARTHGKEVQRLSGIAISATDKAYAASDKAKKSGTTDDHKAAADAHKEAAKLDYDSEGSAEHEAKAAEHEKKATEPNKSSEPEHYYKKGGKDGMRQVALSASKKAIASGNKEDHQEAAKLNNKAMEMAKNEHDDAAFDVHSKIAVKHELAAEHDKKAKAPEKSAGGKFRSGSAEYQAADKEAFEAGDKAKTKEDHAKAAALHLKAAGHAEKDSADEDLHMNMVKEHNRSAK